jgi:hypothetical protein
MNLKHLQRDPAWYSKWMFEDVDFRRKVLEQLRQAIASRNFDDQTTAELQQLLDHEYLSIQYGRHQALLRNGAPDRYIMESWTSELLDQIPQCIVSGPSPLEKEILFRALLSTLNLIRAQGAIQNLDAYRRQLYSYFEYELRNLQPQEHKNPPKLTSNYFRIVQCSFLLRVALDYAQILVSPLPELITRSLERWIACAFSIANPVSSLL